MTQRSKPHWEGPLFIVGPSRTGSVLLREILNRLPQFGLFNETHYFEDFRPRIMALQAANGFDATKTACQIYHKSLNRMAYADLPREIDETPPRRHSPGDGQPQNITAACDAIFAQTCQDYSRLVGARIWGEKTPRHVYQISEILKAFPDARFICTVRDSRAAVASYREWSRVLPEGGDDAERQRRIRSYHPVIAAFMWRTAINAAERARAEYGDQTVRLFQFEKLVDDPRRTISDLCEWLDVPFDENCLDVPMQNSSFFREAAGFGITAQPVGRWKSVLSRDEIGVIESLTSRQLDAFEYQRTNTRFPLRALASAGCSFPGAVLRAACANRKRQSSLWGFLGKRLRDIF
jgi:hypothetical protein